MRPLFAILGLLPCLIATRSDELPVIKDWEAIIGPCAPGVFLLSIPAGAASTSIGQKPVKNIPGALHTKNSSDRQGNIRYILAIRRDSERTGKSSN
jgi:hypothetical protein